MAAAAFSLEILTTPTPMIMQDLHVMLFRLRQRALDDVVCTMIGSYSLPIVGMDPLQSQ